MVKMKEKPDIWCLIPQALVVTFNKIFFFFFSFVEAFRKPAAESENRGRRLSFPLCVCPHGKYGGPLS